MPRSEGVKSGESAETVLPAATWMAPVALVAFLSAVLPSVDAL